MQSPSHLLPTKYIPTPNSAATLAPAVAFPPAASDQQQIDSAPPPPPPPPPPPHASGVSQAHDAPQLIQNSKASIDLRTRQNARQLLADTAANLDFMTAHVSCEKGMESIQSTPWCDDYRVGLTLKDKVKETPEQKAARKAAKAAMTPEQIAAFALEKEKLQAKDAEAKAKLQAAKGFFLKALLLLLT